MIKEFWKKIKNIWTIHEPKLKVKRKRRVKKYASKKQGTSKTYGVDCQW